MVYEYITEYTATVTFPLVSYTTAGWYTNIKAIKKMIKYYNEHKNCKAPVVIETEEGDKVVGTVDSSKKIIFDCIIEEGCFCNIKIPLLLRADFNIDQLNHHVVVELYKVEKDSFYYKMFNSFKIESVVIIPKKTKENKNEL